jgi:hypothetical protein
MSRANVLDMSIANVSLSSIGGDLGVSTRLARPIKANLPPGAAGGAH